MCNAAAKSSEISIGPHLRARLDKSRFVGGDHGLGAVADIELHQHRGDVALHRLAADEQLVGDLDVRQALGHQLQHILLPRSEPGDVLTHLGRGLAGPGELLDHAAHRFG